MRNCHTQLYLEISAHLKIWKVSACKIGPQSGISIWIVTHPPTHPPGHPSHRRSLKYTFFPDRLFVGLSNESVCQHNEVASSWDQTKVKKSFNEDDLQWKTTSIGRWLPLEDDLHWKTTSIERWPPLKENLHWKMTSIGRRRPLEYDLH